MGKESWNKAFSFELATKWLIKVKYLDISNNGFIFAKEIRNLFMPYALPATLDALVMIEY